jgi:hypothetical protein
MPATAANLPPEVDGVGGEEQQSESRLDRERDQAEGDLHHEDRQEPALIAGQPGQVSDVASGREGRLGRRLGAGLCAAAPTKDYSPSELPFYLIS